MKADSIVEWLSKLTARVADHICYVPVSGGTDSAVVFAAACKANPGKVFGIHFPGKDLLEKDWFAKTGQVIEMAAHADASDTMRWCRSLQMAQGLAPESKGKGYLLGTRNKTESILGTFSLASRVPGIQPLAQITKSDVLELCKYFKIPEPIIASSRKADIECGRPPEMAAIGIERIDAFLFAKAHDLTKEEMAYVIKLRTSNSWKRRPEL